MNTRNIIVTAVASFGVACVLSGPANANYTFSGSGVSGNFVGQAAEPWVFNNDTPHDNWGSPGVSAGVTPYLEAEAAYGLDLTFTGVGPIDPDSITLGNGSACIGSGGGGTTFCNEPFGTSGLWTAFLTGPYSIAFRAQDMSQVLDPGENFFVNVFFTGESGTRDFSFTGEWITDFSPTVPLPGVLPLLAAGFGVMGGVLARKKKRA